MNKHFVEEIQIIFYRRLLMLAIATKTWKNFNLKLSIKNDVPMGSFMPPLQNADTGSVKYIYNKHLGHKLAIFEHYQMIRTTYK